LAGALAVAYRKNAAHFRFGRITARYYGRAFPDLAVIVFPNRSTKFRQFSSAATRMLTNLNFLRACPMVVFL